MTPEPARTAIRRWLRPDPSGHVDTDPRVAWPWAGHEPAATHGVVEAPLWFGPAERPRFGWLTRPADGRAAAGVVLCPPIGEEARSTFRAYRRLGLELARRGIVALRVDYDGTGDSAGGQLDPDRVDAWRQSIRDAAQVLRDGGVPMLAVLGMRMGATLAATVAAEAGGFTAAVLWDSCAGGRSFLREQQALHALGDFQGDSVEDADPTGGVQTPGFYFDADTVADLRALKLADLPPLSEQPWCDRVLVLTRTGRPITGPAGLPLTGPRVEWLEAENQRWLTDVEPSMTHVPHPVVARVADWLADGVADAARPILDLGAAPDAGDDEGCVLTDPRSGAPIRERVVSLGPHGLFGIVSEPLEPRADAAWLVMVSAAIEAHIGPGRRWVDYNRSWAALGLRCLRFDHSGVGLSPHRPGHAEDRIFDPGWLDDLPEVIDSLVDDAPAGRRPDIALLGLCSGGYYAFEAAMRRPVDAVFVVSTGISHPQMARGQAAHDPRRRAARPMPAVLARLFHHNSKAAVGLFRLWRQFVPWRAPGRSVHALVRAGTTVRVLANPKDAEEFREVLFWSVLMGRVLRRRDRFRVLVDAGVDHALMTQRGQRQAYAHATGFFTRRYGVATGATTPYRDGLGSGDVLVLGHPAEVGVARPAGQ